MLRNKISSRNRRKSSLDSLWILFSSRRKNAIIYMFATISGLFCVPGGFVSLIQGENLFTILPKVIFPPASSLLIAAGMYVLNDLTDVETDRINNKNRPIASGTVSKKDGIVFILLANGAALALTSATANVLSIIVIIPLIVLGPLYSFPRFALKDKFLLKTLSISAGMILCLMLGATANFDLGKLHQSWLIAGYAAAMVGMMVFITSPYNDLGDMKGDRESGRRTIPIVLGVNRTLVLIGAIAIGMLSVAWAFTTLRIVGLPAAICQIIVAALVLVTVFKTFCKPGDTRIIRILHSKLVPLHTVVHLGIILGALFAW